MGAATIYALSSAHGKAGVSVVRVSGPAAFDSFRALTGRAEPGIRKAVFTPLKNPEDNTMIDHALVLCFENPHSFTGEKVVEYQLHGSPAVLESLFSALSKCQGHRPAEHGEYTRRAFENGKLDLTEAEAIADLINAETAAQKEQALLQMGGVLSRLYAGWRERLVRIMAYIEAVIDFPDENIPDSQILTQRPALEALQQEIREHLNDNRRGERLREGIHIVVLGAPNAGKSSLINALAQRDVAIVSPMAGTTRDIVEVHLNLAGYPVIVSDTAGLRDLSHARDDGHAQVEGEGIRRALARANESDLRILLFDGTVPEDAQTSAQRTSNTIIVYNKADEKNFTAQLPDGALRLSIKTGDGMKALLSALETNIKSLYEGFRDAPSLTRARHRATLEECVSCLDAACVANVPELMAEEIRSAARALGRITGRVDVEDLLDVIFRDFCIGK